jgi:hypothetical protein
LRLTLRHYYDFGTDRAVVGPDLTTPEAWDGLRTRTSGVFSIPRTRTEFVRAAEGRHEIAARAREIDAWLEERGAKVVASYGVGGASLEWSLANLRSNRKLLLTDYGQATVERLAEVFPEADVRCHDLRQDVPLPAEIHLFHRIETELSNREWCGVYERFNAASILVVVAELLDLRRLVLELRNRPALRLRHASRAGFVRTRGALEALWQPTHTAESLRMHDLDAWALTPRRDRDPT